MAKKAAEGPNVAPDEYVVEAIVTVDDRGQLVLPKAIRQRMGLVAGDRLALVALERNGKVCCLNLFKASRLDEPARSIVVLGEGA